MHSFLPHALVFFVTLCAAVHGQNARRVANFASTPILIDFHGEAAVFADKRLHLSDGTASGTRAFGPTMPVDALREQAFRYGNRLCVQLWPRRECKYIGTRYVCTDYARAVFSDGTASGTRIVENNDLKIRGGRSLAGAFLGVGSEDTSRNRTGRITWVEGQSVRTLADLSAFGNTARLLGVASSRNVMIADTRPPMSIWSLTPPFGSTREIGRDYWLVDRSAATSGGFVYFSGRGVVNRVSVHAVFRSDGATITALGEKVLTESPRIVGALPAGRVLFSTSTKLWTTDGTQVGTQSFLDLARTWTAEGALLDNARLFPGRTRSGTYELYRSDGTKAGTSVLVQGLGELVDFVPVGHRRCYFVEVARSGPRLWTSNGTASGTTLVAGAPPVHRPRAVWNGYGASLVHTGGKLFFASGTELWCVDLKANVQSIGDACGPKASSIAARDPILGKGMQMKLRDASVRSAALLMISARGAKGFEFRKSCFLRVDLATLAVQASLLTDASGSANLSIALPNSVSLLGLRAVAQAVVVRGATMSELDLSNGLVLTMGY